MDSHILVATVTNSRLAKQIDASFELQRRILASNSELQDILHPILVLCGSEVVLSKLIPRGFLKHQLGVRRCILRPLDQWVRYAKPIRVQCVDKSNCIALLSLSRNASAADTRYHL